MDPKDLDKIKDPDVREAAEEMAREAAPEPVKEPVKEPEPPKEPEKAPEVKDPLQPSMPERPVEGEPVWKQKEREKEWRKGIEDKIESAASKQDIAELKSLIGDLAKAKTPAAQEDAADDIKAFAEEKGLAPEIIQGIIELAEKRVKPASNPKVEEAVKFYEEQTALRQQEAKAREVREFWDNKFEEDLKALPDEAKAVSAELKKLYYDPRYAGEGKTPYALEHIWVIEKENLVAPKKKSAESGGSAPKSEVTFDTENKDEMAKKYLENEKNMTPEQQREIQERLFTRSNQLQKKNNSL